MKSKKKFRIKFKSYLPWHPWYTAPIVLSMVAIALAVISPFVTRYQSLNPRHHKLIEKEKEDKENKPSINDPTKKLGEE